MFGNMFGGGNQENTQAQVQELVQRLKEKANLNDEQAQQVIHTIKNFVVEKYPMLQGAVSSMFGEK